MKAFPGKACIRGARLGVRTQALLLLPTNDVPRLPSTIPEPTEKFAERLRPLIPKPSGMPLTEEAFADQLTVATAGMAAVETRTPVGAQVAAAQRPVNRTRKIHDGV